MATHEAGRLPIKRRLKHGSRLQVWKQSRSGKQLDGIGSCLRPHPHHDPGESPAEPQAHPPVSGEGV